VRVVNHTLLLIPGVPRLSTNVRSVSQTLTHALFSSTEKLRVVVNHPLLLTQGVSRFSTDVRFSDLNLQRRTSAIFTITESFSAVTHARNKSHTTPDTGVTKFSTNERSVYLNTHFLSITKSCSAVTRARSESNTRLLLLWSVSRFSTNMRFGELNLHRRTFEHHRVPLDSDSCA